MTTYAQKLGGTNYEFSGLVDLMAKATPARSGCGRFWLTFHLPTKLVITISTPTIARSRLSTKAGGESVIAHIGIA